MSHAEGRACAHVRATAPMPPLPSGHFKAQDHTAFRLNEPSQHARCLSRQKIKECHANHNKRKEARPPPGTPPPQELPETPARTCGSASFRNAFRLAPRARRAAAASSGGRLAG
eukprot:252481-Pleurochrysis_carterae.AAC.6